MRVFAPDREGLFYRICAGLAAAGANIIDARIHTTRDGMALDNLLVLDGRGRAYRDRRLRGRLARSVEAALTQREPPPLPPAETRSARQRAFSVAPSVSVAEQASTPDHGRRGQCARPAGAARQRWPARSTSAGHASIRRISPPTASARSTSSI